jgi:hypothetical protein
VRVLREVGALTGVSTPLKRREVFSPDLHLRRLVEHWIEGRLKKHLNSGRNRLEGIVRDVPARKNGATKILKGRLKTLQSWHDKTRALMPVVKAFLKVT